MLERVEIFGIPLAWIGYSAFRLCRLALVLASCSKKWGSKLMQQSRMRRPAGSSVCRWTNLALLKHIKVLHLGRRVIVHWFYCSSCQFPAHLILHRTHVKQEIWSTMTCNCSSTVWKTQREMLFLFFFFKAVLYSADAKKIVVTSFWVYRSQM